MLTLPNIITLIRLPLALLYLYESVPMRATILILAMLSDALDGYFARRYNYTSRVGTFLDPLADKLFVFAVLGTLLSEGRLLPWEAITMLCRDFSVMIFAVYLMYKGNLAQYQFRAIWCGKLMTALQFVVLFCLTCHISLPPLVYFLFIALGLTALVELYLERGKLKVEG